MPKSPEKFDKFDPEKTIYFSPEERAKFAEKDKGEKEKKEKERNRPFEFLSEQLDQIKNIRETKLVERGKYDEAGEILEKIEQTCADNLELLNQLPADIRRHLDREIYLIREKIGEYKELDLPEEERAQRKTEKRERIKEKEGELAEILEQRRQKTVEAQEQEREEELRKARSEAKEAFGEKEEE